jgi:hypothetical protein
MQPSFRFLGLAALLSLWLAPAGAEETERKFHTPQGGGWTGTLVDVKNDRAILKTAEGKQIAIPLAKLAEPDKRYIARFVTERQEAASLGADEIAKEIKMAATLAEAPREWTSTDDKKIQGKLESYDGKEVQIRTMRGVFKFPPNRLSDLDQRLLRRWVEQRPAQAGKWPDFVEAPADLELSTPEETVQGWPFIHRSSHFEFRAASNRLSKSVIKEFARVFEATFELTKALPVGFDPKTPESGYFLTELYDTMESYLAAGGLKGSGGCFKPADNKIMVPLTSLGVKQVGNRWILETEKNSGTLNHEITHQVLARWQRNWPVWFVEGIAEYVQGIRYNKGRYSLKDLSGDVRDDILKYPVQGKTFPMLPLEKLMAIDYEGWSNAMGSEVATYNYRSAHVLMYYFLHLDGKGDGSSVATFLRALNQGEEPKKALADTLIRGRDYAALSQEVLTKLNKAGIRIEYK